MNTKRGNQFGIRPGSLLLVFGLAWATVAGWPNPRPLPAQQDGQRDSKSFQIIRISPQEIAVALTDKGLVKQLDPLSTEQLAGVLEIRVKQGGNEPLPPVAGKVTRGDANQFVFRPRYRLRRGLSYTVTLRLQGRLEIRSIQLAPESSPPAQLKMIFPSANVIPENNLKFYLHFTAPMQKGDIYRFVQIRTADSRQPVELPFLELEQEFWSRDSLRLTLLLDPGRIKRGLKPREETGPIFRPGEEYELVVSGKWPDHAGRPLGADVVKRFRAGEYDESQPRINDWKLEPPARDTKETLTIKFPEPLDHSMLQRAIQVRSPDGQFVAGNIRVTECEQWWQFTPVSHWIPGRHSIVVDNTLEDLAGNSIGKMFDVDVFGKPDDVPDSGVSELALVIE